MTKKLKTLLFIPNIIDYIRFCLICWSWWEIDNTTFFLMLYSLSTALDMIDGWAARKLQQVSNFGALLDVVVDNFGRGVLWCHLGKYGFAISAWEWLVFGCNHAQCHGTQWKEQFKSAPFIVKKIMENGFKTTIGSITVAGLDVLPIWFYMIQAGVPILLNFPMITNGVTLLLLLGRTFAAIAETWCVWAHICSLL